MALFLIMQVCLGFGVAGLMWPEKFMPLFGILMFPWPASYRAIRVNSIVLVGAYLLVIGKLLIAGF
jgi:hypothetical protein